MNKIIIYFSRKKQLNKNDIPRRFAQIQCTNILSLVCYPKREQSYKIIQENSRRSIKYIHRTVKKM